MISTTRILLAACVALNVAHAMVIDPCAISGKKDVNYFGTNECDKFITCSKDLEGHMSGEIMSCGFGTYWSNEKLVCVAVNETAPCNNDKCANLADNTILYAENNCRGFWKCAGGRSLPFCCYQGLMFNNETMTCASNFEGSCNETCLNDNTMAGNETEEEPIACHLSEVPDFPRFYYQYIEGHGQVMRPCAAGTVFISAQCGCGLQESQTQAKYIRSCKPQLNLTFDGDYITDSSQYRYYVENHYGQVSVYNGGAVFNGESETYLSIPRFASLVETSTIVIKMKYVTSGTTEMALLSNNFHCDTAESIRMTENSEGVTFYAKTGDNDDNVVIVPSDGQELKEVTYVLDQGELAGINGNTTRSTPANGDLVNTQCSLTIGQAKGRPAFRGVLFEFTVYLCSPDDN